MLITFINSVLLSFVLSIKQEQFVEILNYNFFDIINYLRFIVNIIVFFILFRICEIYLGEIKRSIKYVFSSIFVALLMYIGICFTNYHTVFDTPFFFFVLYIYSWTILTLYVLNIISLILKLNNPKWKIIKYFESLSIKQLFIRFLLIILIFWSPYILLRYPAGIEEDASYQILQALGMREMTNHWPIFSSFVMGSFVKMGKILFDSYSVGLFSFSLFQAVFAASVFSFSLIKLKEYGIKTWLTLFILFLYSIMIVFPGWITTVCKDSLFSMFSLLFVLLFTDIIFEKNNKFTNVYLSIVAILMSMLRNNGIYVVIFTFVAYLIYCLFNKARNKKTLICLMISILVFNVYSKVIIPNMGIKNGSIAEALSLPFQQTARYFRDYSNEVTEEEYETVNLVLDAENIGNKYNPAISDPVKGTFKENDKALKNYFKIWMKMFMKHPGVYFDATLENTYGFYYPSTGISCLNNGLHKHFVFDSDPLSLYHSYDFLKNPLFLLTTYTEMFGKIPVIRLFTNVAIYLISTIVIFILSIFDKNKKMIICLIPSLTAILVCIASPTWIMNGFRYALPIVVTAPFLISLYGLKN